MPRILEGSAPKPIVSLRIDPDLLAAVKAVNPNLGRAVDTALRLWLAREKRRQPKGAPPTAREMRKDDAA